MKRILRGLVVAVLAICSAGAVQEAAAQSRVGVGYVANAPRMFVGGSAHMLTDIFGGMGLYVDAKFDRQTPEGDQAPILGDLTVDEVEDQLGDELILEDEVWQSFNVALIRPVTPELMLYAGGGMAERENYRQYYDGTGSRGLGGYYWVEDPEASGNEVNFMAGGMFRISSVFFVQFGAESAPRGATVGVIYSHPLK